LAVVSVLSFVYLVLAVNLQDGPSAVDQFTADFTITLNYSIAFSSGDIPGYNPPPFIWSPPIQPLKGKLYFSYPTAQFRLDIVNGDGSPWEFAGTTIVHSYNYAHGEYSFNCTTDVFETTGVNQCWYGTNNMVGIPNQMGGELNLTYVGVQVVNNYECMIWQGFDGTTFAVRLTDLAVIQIVLPYALTQAVPVFSFFGLGRGHTTINFENIVVGAPDPAVFQPPKGICLDVYPPSVGVKSVHYKEIPKFVDNMISNSPLVSLIRSLSSPIDKFMDNLQSVKELGISLSQEKFLKKREVSQSGPVPPKLNQIFSARWTLNASDDLTPPYTPYILAGDLAFDFTLSGLYWSIDTIQGNIPLDVKFNWRLNPTRYGVEFVQVSPDSHNCYSYVFLQWLFTYLVPNFEVPYDCAEEPSVVINGDACSVWQTTYNWYDRFAELYVRDSDHQLVQLTIPEPFGHGLATITLTNIASKVNPASYATPDNCVNTMTWNPSWESHLPWDWCGLFC